MNKALFVAVAVSLVVALGHLTVMEAVTCDILELASCLPAFRSNELPSVQCCAKLKEQEPCLCAYMKDPAYAKYLKSPPAKKVEQICGVPEPTCN
ncbi:hypothetical protein LguiA_014138 [Lonicera macranthoides]